MRPVNVLFANDCCSKTLVCNCICKFKGHQLFVTCKRSFFIKKSKYLKWQFKKIVAAIYKREKIMSESVTELQFTAVSKSPEMWKSVSSAIMTIVDEAYFEAGPTGLTFRSMDPSHVALVDLSWPNSAFEKYECPSTIKFGLKMSDFAKIIKRSNSNDSIEIGIKDNSLNIKTSGGYTRCYKMNLIESADTNASPLPKLSFDSKIVIGTSALDKALNDIYVISDNIGIETIAGKAAVTFSGSNDTGTGMVTIDEEKNNNENLLQEVEVKENSKSSYNMEFISKMVRALGCAYDTITLEYSSKKPLRLQFTALNSIKVQFFLAPRID
jgi:proliferating cell nuclear antigen